jgi:hypothetical protein
VGSEQKGPASSSPVSVAAPSVDDVPAVLAPLLVPLAADITPEAAALPDVAEPLVEVVFCIRRPPQLARRATPQSRRSENILPDAMVRKPVSPEATNK